jgi:L1 cell adhesion molecule like protein
VDPSHVRNLTGTYAEAFAKHEVRFGDEKDKVHKWRDALHQAANMSGWHFKPGYVFAPSFLYIFYQSLAQ